MCFTEVRIMDINVFHHIGFDSQDLHRIVVALEKIAQAMSTDKAVKHATHDLNKGADALETAVTENTPK